MTLESIAEAGTIATEIANEALNSETPSPSGFSNFAKMAGLFLSFVAAFKAIEYISGQCNPDVSGFDHDDSDDAVYNFYDREVTQIKEEDSEREEEKVQKIAEQIIETPVETEEPNNPFYMTIDQENALRRLID